MKKKEDKRKEVESLRGELERVKHLFVAGFEKLKVAQDFELQEGGPGRRRQLPGDQEQPGGEGCRGHPGAGTAARGWWE